MQEFEKRNEKNTFNNLRFFNSKIKQVSNNPNLFNSYENNHSSEASSNGIFQKVKLSNNIIYKTNIQRNWNQNHSNFNPTNLNPIISNFISKATAKPKKKINVKLCINKGNICNNIINKNNNASTVQYTDLQDYYQKYEPKYASSSNLKYKDTNRTRNILLTNNPKSEINFGKNVFLGLKK